MIHIVLWTIIIITLITWTLKIISYLAVLILSNRKNNYLDSCSNKLNYQNCCMKIPGLGLGSDVSPFILQCEFTRHEWLLCNLAPNTTITGHLKDITAMSKVRVNLFEWIQETFCSLKINLPNGSVWISCDGQNIHPISLC